MTVTHKIFLFQNIRQVMICRIYSPESKFLYYYLILFKDACDRDIFSILKSQEEPLSS